MTLAAAPHPPSVFRYLKQAWRDYLSSGNAQTLTVTTVPTHAAAAVTTVSGTVLVDGSCPKPVSVTVTLTQSATIKGTQTTSADAAGAWTVTFPGATCVAGTATATATTPYGPPVTTAAFTLT